MDHRIALKPNTPLCLSNDSGETIHCIIKNELGVEDPALYMKQFVSLIQVIRHYIE